MEPVPRWENRAPTWGKGQIGTESEHRLGIRAALAYTMPLTLKPGESASEELYM